MVPVRWGPELASAVNPTLPLPVPEAPEVIVIQVALLTAIHEHPFWLVTVTLSLPPPAAKPTISRTDRVG
jgi:hypothetical protein